MSSNYSSGTKPSASSSSAKFREHTHGRQDREYTSEQKSAVERIRKCKVTAYYEILAIEKEATDGQIKKAYHKLSLATHPDKNGAPGADEAFKLVSKAFQVLSDPQKRRVFDQTGGDPEARFGGAGGGMHPEGNPFARFGGASAGRPMFEGADVSAEELFNMFFGGGLGGGIFSEMTGGQFAPFGGPGVRVHQFGGDPRARRRTAPQPERTAAAEEPTSFSRMLLQLLPLLIFFILPLLSNLFAGVADVPRGPQFSMDPVDPYTHVRYTPVHKIPFYVNPKDLVDLSVRDLVNIEKRAENTIVAEWNNECRREEMRRDQAIQDATGIIFTNHEKLKQAKQMPMPKCRKLEHLGERRRREL